MSRESHSSDNEIRGKADLVEWFRSGCTPQDQLLIGVEHEKPPFYLADNSPVPYKTDTGRPAIREYLERVEQGGWEPGYEGDNLIELRKENVGITLEPAGQIETGGAPLRNVHQSACETDRNIKELVEAGQDIGVGLLAVGYHPTVAGKDLPVTPKSRYAAWRRYINEQGIAHGVDGANCTSALQVNLGYTSEEDMVKMVRVSISLQPIATALFASSPFSEGEPNGFQSYRSEVIHGYMNGRYGFMLPVAFEEGFGFEKFVDYALDMPMMGIYDQGKFTHVGTATFRDYMENGLPEFPGRKATIADWENHLNTIWPEVRVRKFLEMRGTDNGPAEMIKALPAFWVGLLYDKPTLDKAYEMVRDWTAEDREYLRAQVPRSGLQTPFMGTTVQEIARNCVALADAGLKNRAVRDEQGNDESVYLAPLKEIADSGKNWAVRLLERFYGAWKGDVSKIYDEMSYDKAPSVLKTPAPLPQQQATPAAARKLDGLRRKFGR